MGESSNMDWSLVVAILGVAVSLYAAYVANEASKRSGTLDQRMVAIEEARDRHARRAQMSYKLADDPTAEGRRYIEIRNTGQAEARNISVLLDGKPVTDHPLEVIRNFVYLTYRAV